MRTKTFLEHDRTINFKVNDKVNIIYITQMNCEPKRRKLNNLIILEIKSNSIVFLQYKRQYEISKDCIKVMYVNE